MKLNEVLDKPYGYKWDFQPSKRGDARASFITDNKVDYVVEFISFDVLGEKYEIAFYSKGRDPSQTYAGDINLINVTKSGDQFRVFATVVKVIEDFLSKKKPKIILFNAKEESRRRLYMAFIKKYASKFGYKYKGKDKIEGEIRFVLRKK